MDKCRILAVIIVGVLEIEQVKWVSSTRELRQALLGGENSYPIACPK